MLNNLGSEQSIATSKVPKRSIKTKQNASFEKHIYSTMARS